MPRLFSIGEDRVLVEYDLIRSSIQARCGRDTAEIQSRHSRGTAEARPRSGRDTAEIWPRNSRDLTGSDCTIQDGIQLRKTLRIEQTAVPAGLCWIGPQRAGGEPCLVASNDLYKLKIVSVDTMATVQTVLGPTYGGALTKMLMLPTGESGDRYMAYSTAEKVVGLLKLPLDGNPNKAMGLIAHPAELSGLAVSWDGTRLVAAATS